MLYDFGDRVVIKSWDEMADQYPAGIERIRMPVYDFVNNMEQWCEEVLQIRNVLSDHYTMYGCSGYCFTDDMIRCKAPSDDELGDEFKGNVDLSTLI